MIGHWQIVWLWNPVKWDIDFERIESLDGDGGSYLCLTLACFGPLRVGYHHYPPE